MQIELMPTEWLVPYARNARTHTDEQVAQITASIVEFGFTKPLPIGEGVIIAGHSRLLAAQGLGMAEAPVVVLGHLKGAQRRALTDNKIAENDGWDEELLRTESALSRSSTSTST